MTESNSSVRNFSSTDFAATQRQRDMDNDVELFRHGQEAFQLIEENRPKNTKKNYEAKFKEWDVRSNFSILFRFIQTD